MPAEETKVIILHKKGYIKYITNYIPISLPSHMNIHFTRILQKGMEKVLDEQPRKEARFRKGYSTVDHLQTINQLRETYNEYIGPLCIG